MCGKGSQTTTQNTQQTQTPNPQAMGAYNNVLNQAQGVAATPYQPYGGQLVAPINQQQGMGISNINQYQPAYQTALGMAYQGAQPITQQQIQQYESPYTQQVVNATQAQFNNQNAQQQQGVLGNAAAQGALGGNRVGIAQAELANQQNLAQAPVIANLENQGYMTGLNTALTEQQALSQGAYGVAGMANAGLGGANAQIGAGTLEQQTGQAQDTAAYQQYLNAMGYPFQTTQWLAGIDTGVGSQMGGTTTGQGTTTGPPPNQTAGLLGAGIGALGFAGNMGWLAPLATAGAAFANRGGAINGYADGGGVAGPQYPVIPESPHTLHAQQEQLVDGDRHVQMFPHGTSELPLPRGMQRTESHSGVFHHNPKHVSSSDIHKFARGGHEHLLLGLGPFSKHEIVHRIVNGGEHPVTIVERNEHGHEVRTAIGTHTTAHVQHHHMMRGKSRNHTVHIEHPHKVLSERMQHIGRQAGGGIGGASGVSNYPIGSPFGPSSQPYSGGSGYVGGLGLTYGHTLPPGMQPPPAAGQTPQDFSKIPGMFKDLNKEFSGLQKQDSSGPLAGLDPSSQSDYISQQDEAAMEEGQGTPGDANYELAYNGGEARGGAVGVANYAGGGNVEPMPMSLDDMQQAFDRLNQRGLMNKPAAQDFASARLQRMGIAPSTIGLQPPKYDRGGVANYDTGGGEVPADYDPRTPLPARDRTEADAYGPDTTPPPLPTPKPQDLSSGSPTSTGEDIAPQVPSDLPLPRPHPESVGVQQPLDASVQGVAASPDVVHPDLLGRAREATKHQESGGDYSNVTTTHDRHGNPQSALGAYGIMDFNLPQWSQAALGHTVSREEFLKNPDIQDQIYNYKMGNYISRFGVEGAGRAWLGGEGALNAPRSTDAFGTSVGSYGNKFASLVGGEAGKAQTPPGERPPGYNQRGVGPPPTPENKWGADNPAWGAMMAAGFGMMASRSPFLGQAVGEGLQQGLGSYYQQKQITTNQTLAAQKLSQEADRWEKNYQLGLQKQAIEESKPAVYNDPILGPRPIFRDPKNPTRWLFGDTGQPVGGPGSGASAVNIPSSDDPTRPFKNATASSATVQMGYERGMHGQGMVDAIPQPLRNTAEAVANYQAPISDFTKMGKAGMSQDRALGLVRQINPDYDQNWYSARGQGYKNFYASTNGQSALLQSRTFNTATGHAGELAQAFHDLNAANPGSVEGLLKDAHDKGIPFLSYLAGEAAKKMATGTPEGEAYAKINAVVPLYGAETEKFYAGGPGSETGRQAIEKSFDTARSYREAMAALYQQKEMFKSKTAPLEAEYKDLFEGGPGQKEYGSQKVREWHVARDSATAANEVIDRYAKEAGVSRVGIEPGKPETPTATAPAQPTQTAAPLPSVTDTNSYANIPKGGRYTVPGDPPRSFRTKP